MKEIVNGMTNEMKLEFDSRSANEAFARVTVASFMTQLNPTLEEVSDVKTAVSEAVTNAIIHGYENHVNKVQIYAGIEGRTLHLEISDRGRGNPRCEKSNGTALYHQTRVRTVRQWAFHLWKLLWMKCR